MHFCLKSIESIEIRRIHHLVVFLTGGFRRSGAYGLAYSEKWIGISMQNNANKI